MTNDKKKNNDKSVFDELNRLIALYAELEILTANLLEINIQQLENKISKSDAEIILLDLASRQIDLDGEIYQLKKSLGFVECPSNEKQKSLE